MERRLQELAALDKLRWDIWSLSEKEKKLQALKEERAGIFESCSTKNMPTEPHLDTYQGFQLEKKREALAKNSGCMPVLAALLGGLLFAALCTYYHYLITGSWFSNILWSLLGGVGLFFFVHNIGPVEDVENPTKGLALHIVMSVIFGGVCLFVAYYLPALVKTSQLDGQYSWAVILFPVLRVVCVLIGSIRSMSRITALNKKIANSESQAKAEYQQRMAKYQQEYQQIYQKNLRDSEARIQAIDAKIKEAERQRNEWSAAVQANTLLGSSDKNLEMVDYLIKKLESRRADSITEALQQYDSQQQRAARARSDAILNSFYRQQQMERQAQQDFEQKLHNMEVEAQQRRQTEELERIRKSLEN